MNKDFLIKLTKNLYRLTLLFPKKEPLRYKMRELADEILIKVINFNFLANPGNIKEEEEACSIVLKDLDILTCFFEIVKDQKWVKTDEIFEIQREYEKLFDELIIKKNNIKLRKKDADKELSLINVLPTELKPQKIQDSSQDPIILSADSPVNNISKRQEKILAFLRQEGKAQVWQAKKIFPEVTKRTLRRDFEKLLRRGVIERVGERSNTFYQIKVS